jgi:AcrR family transcriptional regulator
MNEADPRVKRTRKLLQDAFMSLLAEKSFQAISVQEIAERATLNRATFYAHFEDKYALADHMLSEQFRGALARRMTPDAPYTPGNLRLLIATVCEFVGAFHGHCAPNAHDLDARIEARLQREIETILYAWLADTVTASVMSWAIFGASLQWSRSERGVSANEWARQVAAALSGGIAPEALATSRPL